MAWLKAVWFCLLAMVLLPALLAGQAKLSPTCDQALFEILNLRTKTARALIQKARVENPKDLYTEFLDDWADVIDLIAYEQDDRYEKYLEAFEKRVERMESTYDKASPSYNILMAELHAHAGMANLLYNDYLAGFRKFLSANKYVKKNVSEHPGYWMNDKLQGIMNVGFDLIPSGLKWFAGAFGLRGNANTGYRQLSQYIKSVQYEPGLRAEATLFYFLAFKMAKRDAEACQLMQAWTDVSRGPALNIFMLANMQYVTSKNEEALATLSKFPRSSIEVPFRTLSHLEGRIKVNRLDPDADAPLNQFLKASNARNNKRDACMRLAYFFFMQNKFDQYQYYKKLINNFPKAKMDRDKEADIEMTRSYNPHPQLLKMRFLVAGGYYAKAAEISKTIVASSLSVTAYQTEYYLLLAKILLNERRYQECIGMCTRAIEKGKDQKEQYAAEAAVVAGAAALQQNNMAQAKLFWEQCLSIKGNDDVYIEGIHKIAKFKLSGLNGK
jgi:tetratricopeptide (TPR) repeat protein